jgi:carboxylesterase
MLTGMLIPALAAIGVAALVARVLGARAAERESARGRRFRADGLLDGAEPIALDGDGTRAVLVLHGFGDTPQTVRYLCEHLHALGWTVRAPLLPGHGRTLREFAASGSVRWIAHARAELEALVAEFGPVPVVGLSMGGAIASVLADECAEVTALALVAPYVSMPTWLRRVARGHLALGTAVAYLRGRGERSIHDPAESARNLAYGFTTPRLVAELHAVVRRARHALPRLRVPTLVVQSREDNRIPADAAERAYAMLRAPVREIVWLEGCGHVVTVDYGRERVFDLVADWLERYRSGATVTTVVEERAR